MDRLNFDGRVAVITGGGRGIGRAYAELLGSRGAKVVVNDPGVRLDGTGADEGPAAEVVDAIRAAGGSAIANLDSVTTSAGGESIVRTAVDAFGRIDILIHNAGVVLRSPLGEMSHEDMERSLDVHLRGGFHVVRAAFPLMCAAGYGRIVLTASCSGIYGNHLSANYAMGKMGLIGLSNVAALEGHGKGVSCNVIIPAAVTRMAEGLDTSLYPPMGSDLVAPAVVWLAHERCTVTGEMFVATAGRIARAYMAETPGVYRGEWSVEDVDREMEAIRTSSEPVVFSVVPSGQADHLRYSFAMAKQT